MLFALTNVARRMGVDAESALRASTAKFRERWSFIEGAAEAQGRAVEDLAMAEMEALLEAGESARMAPRRQKRRAAGCAAPCMACYSQYAMHDSMSSRLSLWLSSSRK